MEAHYETEAPFQARSCVTALYAAAAGWHDGQKMTVSITDSDDLVVAFHEKLHEEVFLGTPDGQVLSNLLWLEEAYLGGRPGIPVAVRASVDTLMGAVPHAHEVVATYLAIKLMPVDQQARQVDQLLKAYSTWYARLSSVVDATFRSSYLQYVVGWNVAVVTFSSPLLGRMAATDLNVPIRLQPQESPAWRLARVLDALRAGDHADLLARLNDAAAATCRRLGQEPFDPWSPNRLGRPRPTSGAWWRRACRPSCGPRCRIAPRLRLSRSRFGAKPFVPAQQISSRWAWIWTSTPAACRPSSPGG